MQFIFRRRRTCIHVACFLELEALPPPGTAAGGDGGRRRAGGCRLAAAAATFSGVVGHARVQRGTRTCCCRRKASADPQVRRGGNPDTSQRGPGLPVPAGHPACAPGPVAESGGGARLQGVRVP